MRVGSHAVVVTSSIVFALGAVVACSAGSAGGSPDGGASGSSGTSGTSGSSGSSGDAGGPCTEFVVGGEVGDGVGSTVPSRVYAQSVADAAQAVKTWDADLAGACRRIAQGLDTTAADLAAAEAKPVGRERTSAFCQLAVAAIGATKAAAGGTIKVFSGPVSADLSVATKGACQGRCAGGPCDLVVNPPSCTGGSLFVDCRGDCQAVAGATLECEPCATTCQSACAGSSCNSTCRAPAGGSVRCDGQCSGAVTPLFCRGGQLEGGCRVDAACDASCNVIVTAKATTVTTTAVTDSIGVSNAAAAAKLKAALEADLPLLASLNARLESLARLSGSVAAPRADVKASCQILVARAASEAVSGATADSVVVRNVVDASF